MRTAATVWALAFLLLIIGMFGRQFMDPGWFALILKALPAIALLGLLFVIAVILLVWIPAHDKILEILQSKNFPLLPFKHPAFVEFQHSQSPRLETPPPRGNPR
ncbi:MAG: hypothetical protein V4568_06465 [Pseudomonadota bacterium]